MFRGTTPVITPEEKTVVIRGDSTSTTYIYAREATECVLRMSYRGGLYDGYYVPSTPYTVMGARSCRSMSFTNVILEQFSIFGRGTDETGSAGRFRAGRHLLREQSRPSASETNWICSIYPAPQFTWAITARPTGKLAFGSLHFNNVRVHRCGTPTRPAWMMNGEGPVFRPEHDRDEELRGIPSVGRRAAYPQHQRQPTALMRIYAWWTKFHGTGPGHSGIWDGAPRARALIIEGKCEKEIKFLGVHFTQYANVAGQTMPLISLPRR